MSKPTRAFFILSLIWLPGAAALQLLALVGMSTAWPAMVHLSLFGWITTMIIAVSYHTMPVFAARDFPFPSLLWGHAATLSTGIILAVAGIIGAWSAATLFTANTILLFTHGGRCAQRAPTPVIAGQPIVDRIGTRATQVSALTLPIALLLLLAVRVGWLSGLWILAPSILPHWVG